MKVTTFYADGELASVLRPTVREAKDAMRGHDGPVQVTREHGRWFVGCNACGRLGEWHGDAGFEEIEGGDDSCG